MECPCSDTAGLAWHDKKQPESQSIHGINTAPIIIVKPDDKYVHQSDNLARASRHHGPTPLDPDECLLCKSFL